MPDVVVINGLSRIFGKDAYQVRALDNVSCSIKRGEFVLLVGSSGSGKSTLLNQIGLLDKPTTGTIHVDGTDTRTLNDGQASVFRNKKLGFVYQFSNLLSDLTVLENVMLPMQVAGRAKSREHAKHLLQLVGLAEHAHKRAHLISGGQAQRAAIARALINEPVLVLADEPTGNLDSTNSAKVVDLMKSMCRQLNQTFLVVTHDPTEFGEVDRTIQLKDGRISLEALI